MTRFYFFPTFWLVLFALMCNNPMYRCISLLAVRNLFLLSTPPNHSSKPSCRQTISQGQTVWDPPLGMEHFILGRWNNSKSLGSSLCCSYQRGALVPPVSSVFPWASSKWNAPTQILREASGGMWTDASHSLNIKEQRLYAVLFPGDWASHLVPPIPLDESHFFCLYPWSSPLS